MRDAVEQFREAIVGAGLSAPEHIEGDGELYRFPTNGKRGDDSGWYVLHLDGVAAGMFGDWRTGIKQTWKADLGRPLSREEAATAAAVIKAAQRKRELAEEASREQARDIANREWNAAITLAAPVHPYLERKRIKPCGTRMHGDRLLVPMRDVHGEVHSLQRIGPDGEKRYLAGGRVKGLYYSIGELRDTIHVCEGFATGASIHEATGAAVAVAFDAGNLEPVARALRAKFPSAHIVICADDDYETEGNPGVTKAKAAAKAVRGRVVVPDFGKERPAGATDFNDLYRALGAAAVRECFIEPDELVYTFADALDGKDDATDELVERAIERRMVSVVYGDSNSGKTFFVIDLGSAVARGVQWMGRMVEGGLVVYLATEGPASVRRRLRAYQLHHGVKVPRFVIVQSPINLFDGAADTERVIRLIRALEQRTGSKCELVIGDTLARLSTGANENSGEDMSVVLSHVDRIRNECGVHFMLIHHIGKDAARGMRGWSGMRAAIDTEIEVTDTDGARVAEITKQRDLEGKGDRIGFRLDSVVLGQGKWGRPITSCVVAASDAPAKVAPGKRPSEIAGAIIECLTSRGSGMKKGDLVDHFRDRYPKGSVYRELKKMREAGALHEVAGVVGLRHA